MADTASGRLKLFKTEDYWAIWLGLALIAAGLVFFLSLAAYC